MMYSLLFDKLYAAGQMKIPEKINKRSFYKFLHETGGHAVLKSCLEGNIMFSRIPELNDFSETFAVADKKDIAKSLSEIQKKGLRKDELVRLSNHVELMKKVFPDLKDLFESLKTLCLPDQLGSALRFDKIKLLASQFGLSFDNPLNVLIDALPNILQLTNEMIQQRIGIFCVAKTFKNFPMWAHYADNARGFVVEYKNLGEIFSGDGETGVFGVLKKVEYYTGKRLAVQFHPSKLNEMFFSKHEAWKYEGEYRVVKPLNECKKRFVGNGIERHLYKINPQKYIKRIIVGWNGDVDEIRNFVKNECDIPVVQAVVRDGNIVVPSPQK